MRKALIVGLNEYKNFKELNGCVEDAAKIDNTLKYNSDGSPNFQTILVTEKDKLTKANLTLMLKELFDDNESVEIALFYFSGHGHADSLNGYLTTYDSDINDWGITMNIIENIISQSKVQNKVIILDCCYSGALGASVNEHGLSTISKVPENTTILSASRKDEVSVEQHFRGVYGGIFTTLLIESLNGASADVLGNITPASIYHYIDKGLGSWGQRPVFKTHTKKFLDLRKVSPIITFDILKKIIIYFPNCEDEYKLDPSYEPDAEKAGFSKPDPINMEIFANLQKYRNAGLIVPVGEEHMYYAAINSKSCKLTALGLQYWKLIKENKLRI